MQKTGDKNFAVAGMQLWNNLPVKLQQWDTNMQKTFTYIFIYTVLPISLVNNIMKITESCLIHRSKSWSKLPQNLLLF